MVPIDNKESPSEYLKGLIQKLVYLVQYMEPELEALYSVYVVSLYLNAQWSEANSKRPQL